MRGEAARKTERIVTDKKKMGAYGCLNNKAMKKRDDSRVTDWMNEIEVFQKTE